jgi:hypothetical protein
MLKYFDKYPDVELVPEPVAQWCDVKGHNLLGIDHIIGRETENINRGPSRTFGDFVTIRTERSMQDITVARLQITGVPVQTPLF